MFHHAVSHFVPMRLSAEAHTGIYWCKTNQVYQRMLQLQSNSEWGEMPTVQCSTLESRTEAFIRITIINVYLIHSIESRSLKISHIVFVDDGRNYRGTRYACSGATLGKNHHLKIHTYINISSTPNPHPLSLSHKVVRRKQVINVVPFPMPLSYVFRIFQCSPIAFDLGCRLFPKHHRRIPKHHCRIPQRKRPFTKQQKSQSYFRSSPTKHRRPQKPLHMVRSAQQQATGSRCRALQIRVCFERP